MDYKVEWSPEAVNDLIEIAKYIERDSPINAAMVVSKFYELTGKYGRNPRGAIMVPELRDEKYRHKLVYNWRTIYRIDDTKQIVYIIAILHGKRLFNNIVGRFIDDV